MKKIAHIVSDEKFIDTAYLSFADNKLAIENTYFCLSDRKELVYIKMANITLVPLKYAETKEFAKQLNSFDLLIFHNLYEKEKRSIVFNVNGKVKIWWIGWGVDYYNIIRGAYHDLFKPETLCFIKRQHSYGQFGYILHNYIKKSFLHARIFRSGYLKRIDYFSPVIAPIEFDLVAGSSHNNFKAKKIDWNYGVLLNNDPSKTKPASFDVIVGNSGAMTNNHVDVFKYISFLDDDRNVIVPLSYSGNEAYKSFVLNKSSEYLKTRFTPLYDYMSLPDFNSMIQHSGFAVFNSIRQQAYGNINFLLTKGVKVFLDARNPIYIYLTQQGVKLFKIEDINAESMNTLLPDIDTTNNFHIIHQLIGEARIKEKTLKALTKIFEGEVTKSP
ncbi:MAG: TDP-N-acetylfucosamine:lipid II N-acetylfucosaminyltransferase [Saprospiraceae bacterium]|nr:TDP-N-acetylfucosamine:lipid II N-acetylfucosaminyltransferase [Saprospiraceae bacterium]